MRAKILSLAIYCALLSLSPQICNAATLGVWRYNLPSNVGPFPNNVAQVPFSETITMPSSGCPCYLRVDYSLFVSNNDPYAYGASVYYGWATANTTEFFAGVKNYQGYGGAGGVSGGALSPLSYTNNQVVNVSLHFEGSLGGCSDCSMTIDAVNYLDTQQSWMVVDVTD